MNKNNKVPMAVLSCFLIAFIVQGMLKISGVFIFEKALDWEIFKIIDSIEWLQIIYYSMLSFVIVYCLSFSLNTLPYSKKWYHYFIIFITVFIVTILKFKIKTQPFMEFIYDALLYITVPVIINTTTDRKYKLYTNSFTNLITIIAINIMLYFCYLGLGYWSLMLNSIIPSQQTVLYASATFLVQFERYIGIVLLMLSLNMFVRKMKEVKI